MQIIQ